MFDEKIDIIEERLISYNKALMDTLLSDKTTKRKIIWATSDYNNEFGFSASEEIVSDTLVGLYSSAVQPRIAKSKEKQLERTKIRGEVFTPAWICNIQNNSIDELWFGAKNVFNVHLEKHWQTNTDKIDFEKYGKSWKDYVDTKRLEITCGEAPYLVSRYDNATGKPIELHDRVGLLDRKLRVVCENVNSPKEWNTWAKRAIESIYGFDFQGDNVLLARENVLYTYIDFYKYYHKEDPDSNTLKIIANIIAWNIWQMDGLTYKPPFVIGSNIDITELPFCIIKDWRAQKTQTVHSIIKK